MTININNLKSQAWELPTFSSDTEIIKVELPERKRVIRKFNTDLVTITSGEIEPIRRKDETRDRNTRTHNHGDRNRR